MAGKRRSHAKAGSEPVVRGDKPGRGYSWEPFQPGHTLSVTTHGAFSRRVLPIAEAILRDVLEDPACEYLKAPRFAAELEAWATAEARVRLIQAYIAKRAEGSGDGVGDLADERIRSAWALLLKCESRAMSGRDRLGLSPLSGARIGRDKAAAGVDMALIMKELARLEEQGANVLENDNDDEDGGVDG